MKWNAFLSFLSRFILFIFWMILSCIMLSVTYAIVAYPSSPVDEYEWGMFSTFIEEILDISDITSYLWSGKVMNADTLEGIDSSGLQITIKEECSTCTFLTSISADGRVGCDGVNPPQGSCGTASWGTLGAAPSRGVLCAVWSTASAVSWAGPWNCVWSWPWHTDAPCSEMTWVVKDHMVHPSLVGLLVRLWETSEQDVFIVRTWYTHMEEIVMRPFVIKRL